MKEIKLYENRKTLSGNVTIVDDEDYNFLNTTKWYEHVNGYVFGCYKGKQVYMHRLLNKTPDGVQTDHENRNRKDNRKENLRDATGFQNQVNAERKNKTTGYRGVTFDKRKKTNPYQSKIRINGKHVHIGMFKTPEEAAMEYNVLAFIYHGEFAILNRV